MQIFPANDPVLIFSIVMTAVLIAPILAEKIRLPGIVGLIFFGIILGPHTLNLLERDKTIDLLGTIGLLYIMFQAGIEINLEEVKRNKHHSIGFGLLTFIIPLVSGTLAGVMILDMSVPASILLASMFSSHTLLTFPIISRMGLSKKKSVTATIGGTIITDTLAFIVLAVIIATYSGEMDGMFWIKLISLSVFYVFTVILLLPRITSWFFRFYLTETGVEDYVFVLTSVFLCAYFSHLIGLEPIIGAFLAGLTLNSLIPEKSALMNRIQFVGNSLFIPFFLISVGMLIDPVALFTSHSALKVSSVMIIIAFASKFLAAYLFSKSVSFGRNETGLVFGMSVNQAAATLAAVMVGYKVGIFESDVLTGTIMMIIATCFFGSVITKYYAVRIARSEIYGRTDKETISPVRILIPVVNDSNIKNLMDFAFLIHPKNSQEPLFPIHIALEREDVEKKIIEGESLLSKAAFKASSVQKSVIPLNRIDNNVPSAILKAVEEQRISKIIMGWNDSGHLVRTFYETLSERVAKSTNRMLIVPKIVEPLNIVKRMILIFPPFLNRQKGFTETLESIFVIKEELSASLVIISEQNMLDEVSGSLKKSKNTTFEAFSDWKNVTSFLKNIIKDHDMIIQILARRYSFAWRPVFQRMPEILSHNFPKNNFTIVYPFRRIETTENEENADDTGILKLVPSSCFYFYKNEPDPSVIIGRVTQEHYSEKRNLIYSALMEVAENFPLELSDDIVLIHNRTGLVNEYGVFIVSVREGVNFRKLETEHKVVIIVLSPEIETAQSHLNMLSRISRIARKDNFVENITSSGSYLEFCEKIKTS